MSYFVDSVFGVGLILVLISQESILSDAVFLAISDKSRDIDVCKKKKESFAKSSPRCTFN